MGDAWILVGWLLFPVLYWTFWQKRFTILLGYDISLSCSQSWCYWRCKFFQFLCEIWDAGALKKGPYNPPKNCHFDFWRQYGSIAFLYFSMNFSDYKSQFSSTTHQWLKPHGLHQKFLKKSLECLDFDSKSWSIFVKIMINDRAPREPKHKGIWFRFSQEKSNGQFDMPVYM